MKPLRLICSLILCAALSLPLGAFAAGGPPYPDLPQEHWAYADITQAVNLGILKGM